MTFLQVFLGLFQAAGDEDDDLDLFGDETEEDKKAVEEREKAKKTSSKKKESELPRSSFCFYAKSCLCSNMSSFYMLLFFTFSHFQVGNLLFSWM